MYLNPALAKRAMYVRKQVNQLPSKMRFVAAQFNALLDGDLWIRLAEHANTMAGQLYDVTSDIPGVVHRRPARGQQRVSVDPARGNRAVAGLVLLLGLGRQRHPGALDDLLGHHRRRCRAVRRRCAHLLGASIV